MMDQFQTPKMLWIEFHLSKQTIKLQLKPKQRVGFLERENTFVLYISIKSYSVNRTSCAHSADHFQSKSVINQCVISEFRGEANDDVWMGGVAAGLEIEQNKAQDTRIDFNVTPLTHQSNSVSASANIGNL